MEDAGVFGILVTRRTRMPGEGGAIGVPLHSRWGTEMRKVRRYFYQSAADVAGRSVSAVERPDSRGRVRLRWTNDAGVNEYYPLRDLRIRDERDALIPERVELVRMMLATSVRARAEGRDVTKALDSRAADLGYFSLTRAVLDLDDVPLGERLGTVASEQSLTSARSATLQEAFDRYFALESGQYVLDSRQRKDEMGISRDIMEFWPPTTPLSDIRTGSFRLLWRWMAAQHFSGRLRTVIVGRQKKSSEARYEAKQRGVHTIRWGGLRHAVRSINTVRKLLRFCAEHELLENVPLLPAKWQTQLLQDWEQYALKVGVRLTKPDQESREYSPEEAIQFYSSASEFRPRLHLMIELAPLWRFGQALRLGRTDYRPDIGRYGAMSCEGRGAKWGKWMWMTEWQRLVLEWALANHLRQWEDMYQAGQLVTYPLFPACRLNSRKPALSLIHLSEPGLRLQFNHAERIAKIKHVPGRGWYGLKRRAQNILEDLGRGDDRIAGLLTGSDQQSEETDGDALRNALSGHSAKSTRELYQRHDRPEIWERAIIVLTALRRQLGGEPDPTRDLQQVHFGP